MKKQSSNPLSALILNGSCLYEGPTGPVCISTNAEKCQSQYKGVFVEGSTCGSASGLNGSCCLWDPENKTILPCQTSTFLACQTLAESFNFKFNWSVVSCKERKCEYVFESKASRQPILGACCNGNGLCKETTQEDCENSQFFYQGNGTICDKGICIEGTGGCCNGVTCNDGITGTYCVENKSLYLGKGKRCWEFTCETNRLPCLDSITTEKLKIGDLFEGGVVVGIYQPGNSKGIGPKFLTNQVEIDDLLKSEAETIELTTIADGRGYGEIEENLCEINYSYIMIMSMSPIVNDLTKTRYTWSRDSNAWGPLFTSWGKILESNTIDLNLKNEGFVYNNVFSNKINNSIIRDNMVNYCNKRSVGDDPIKRLDNRSTQGICGKWSTDWGMYNTIRLTNAKIFDQAGIDYDQYLTKSLYQSGEKFDSNRMVDLATAILEYNKTSTSANNPNTSDWFVASANEWAYILREIKLNNLNETLIAAGAYPITDINWTSTGAFDYKNLEGISETGETCSVGKVALAVNSNTMKFEIRNRMEPALARPIRLVTCNGKYPTSDYSSLWRINK